MNNNTFKSLFDLGRAIHDKAELIGKGKYGLKEIESALFDLNELQERLIVLKYKAIEQLAAQQIKIAEPIEPLTEPQEIEEPVQQKEEKKEAVNVNQMTIMDGINEVEKEATIEPEPIEQKESILESMESDTDSIAEKMENKAISDLKSAISINQRFSFTKNLFDDNGEAFNNALQRIQECDSLDSAYSIVEQLKSEHSWDTEEETVQDFLELVNRRFDA